MTANTTTKAGRLISLDVMRGMTMASMILVNNPGNWNAVFAPLRHATWHGCTFTDLVFPFFLFMVGAALPFSLENKSELSKRHKLVNKILVRGAALFAIGFVLGLLPDVLWNPSSILAARIPGVLQRIAICYVVVALLSLLFSPAVQWSLSLLLVCIYSVGMLFVPVPAVGAGSFEVEGNLCWWIDNQILLGHTYSGSPAAGFDPEGVWSTLTAIAGTQFGYFAGRVLLQQGEPYRKVTTLFIWGQCALLAGYIASFWMPINKQLWTTSYLFLVTGLALNFLALLYYTIEIRQWRCGISFWLVFGTSSIVAYGLSNVLGDFAGVVHIGELSLKSWVTRHFQIVLTPKAASLAWSVAFVLLCWALMWPPYRAKWRIKI